MIFQHDLLDHVAVAIYSVDLQGCCTRINPAALRLLEWSAEECLGRKMHDLIHHHYLNGNVYPNDVCPLLGAFRTGKTVEAKDEVVWTKSGEPIWTDCSSAPILVDGAIVGAVITLQDIRGRRQAEAELVSVEAAQRRVLRDLDEASARQRLEAEEQLRSQGELLRSIVENAPVGIAVLDPELRFRWYNPHYVNALEVWLPDGGLIGQPVTASAPDGDDGNTIAILERVRDTGEPFLAAEFAYDGFARGTTYWRWFVMRLASGDLMMVTNDITEQVQARQELESIYQGAPIGLALFDPVDFRFLRLNERQAQMTGLPREEIVGKTVVELAPTMTEVLEHLRQAARGIPVIGQSIDGVLATNPKEHRYWTVNYFPVYGKDGTVQAITAATHETTAQKKAEVALIQSDKLAAVGRLAASISHEINNPLEAVTKLMYLIAQDRQLSPETRAYVDLAGEELQRVSQITAQALRFHRQSTRPRAIKPQQLLEPVLGLYQGRLANSNILVDLQYRGKAPITCYESDVRQILNNLVSNAMDAMRGTGGRLTVRTEDALDWKTGEPGVRITVADTGFGMSAEVRKRIFEPFYTTKGINGTGLGLWISQTIAERHHGHLRVKSREGTGSGGSVFSLFLPSELRTEARVG